MLHWLVGNCDLFGFNAQNWMLVVTGALVLYLLTLLVTHERRLP